MEALDQVAAKNPRERFGSLKTALRRTQTTPRQEAPLLRTSNLPNSKVRAELALRAGRKAMARKKNIWDQVMHLYMKNGFGDMNAKIQRVEWVKAEYPRKLEE